jgi:ligand-binding sensor domain-containing protein/two-component sensor histidine kinase
VFFSLFLHSPNNVVLSNYILSNTIPYTVYLTILLLYNSPAHSQLNENKFIRYTIQDGLSDNGVTGLAQDENGFVWIGTKNGLNRFDGSEFRKVFRSANGNGNIDEINKLSLNNHQLLLTTRKGIQSLNVRNELLTTYKQPAEPGSIVNDAADAVVTKEGYLLMSSKTGMYVFEKNGSLCLRYNKYKGKKGEQPARFFGRGLASLPDHLYIHFTSNEEIFIFDSRLKKYASVDEYKSRFPNLAAMNRKVSHLTAAIGNYKVVLYDKSRFFFYNGETDRLQHFQIPAFLKKAIGWRMKWYAVNDTTAIVTGQDAGLYVCHFNTTTGSLEIDPHCYFADFLCTAVFKDKDGRLWIGTDKGLLKQDLAEKKVGAFDIRSLSPNSRTGSNYEITAFYRHQNELYVGTYSKDGIYILDAESFAFRQKISFAALDEHCNQVWYILPVAKDTLWFATQFGIVWLNTSNKHFGYVSFTEDVQRLLSRQPVSIAFKDSHNLLWLQGAWGTGLIQYDQHTKHTRVFRSQDSLNYLPVSSASHIIEDGEGNIWVASHGLTRWNRKTDRFDTVMKTYTGHNWDNVDVFSLTTIRQQQVIFANRNNGALFFYPVLKNYRQLTTHQGLPENTINLLLGLNNDHLWMASNNYLSAWNQQTQKIISYSLADGIPQEGGVAATLYHDTVARRVLIGYSTNYIGWVTDSISHTVAQSIPFFIDVISTAGGRNILYPGNELKLPYFENDIRIHVTAINFLDVQNNRLWYRMAGNATWIQEKQNTLNFNNLAPGSYPVEIKVTSASNPWQQVTRKITITIQSPFWQTGWFYMLILLIIAAIVIIGFRWRIKNIRRKAELNNQMAITEMKALHAQMNPHFIFNSLNSIRELILQKENRSASHYLAHFAGLIRMTLHHSGKNFISLEQNVEYLNRYLEMEKLRFNDFVYTIIIDKDLNAGQVEVPPMLLQPLIENAIWHGLKPKAGDKKINVRFLKQNDQLICEIEDNGIGFNKAAEQQRGNHQSVGIDNIKDRIRLLNLKYHTRCNLEIEDIGTMPGVGAGGTLARLTLSLIYE